MFLRRFFPRVPVYMFQTLKIMGLEPMDRESDVVVLMTEFGSDRNLSNSFY